MHLPSRYFTENFTFEDRYRFCQKYGDGWEKPLRFINAGRNRISKSAIEIAGILNEKLELELFPLIIPVACRGFDLSGGTAAFMMHDKNGTDYLFFERASRYKAKNGKYELSYDNRMQQNSIERIK